MAIVAASNGARVRLAQQTPRLVSNLQRRCLTSYTRDVSAKWQRALSRSQTPKLSDRSPIVVVAPSNLGSPRDSLTQSQTPILAALGRRARVIGLSTDGLSGRLPNLSIIPIKPHELADQAKVTAAIHEGLEELEAGHTPHLVGVSLYGTANPKKYGTSLEFENEQKPRALFAALDEIGEIYADRVSHGHVSSIAPTVNAGRGICTYSDSRERIDQEIVTHQPKGMGNVVVLRPGLILADLDPETSVDGGRYWDMYTQASHPLLFVMGSGDQIQEPVDESELCEALYNGLLSDKQINVLTDAPGGEAVTQKQLYRFFNPNAIGYAHIPYPLAQTVADEFPLGKLAPYSPKIFQTLDQLPTEDQKLKGEKFEELLGRKPKGMSEIYTPGSYALPLGSSVWPQGMEIARAVVSDPGKVLRLTYSSLATLGSWSFSKE